MKGTTEGHKGIPMANLYQLAAADDKQHCKLGFLVSFWGPHMGSPAQPGSHSFKHLSSELELPVPTAEQKDPELITVMGRAI